MDAKAPVGSNSSALATDYLSPKDKNPIGSCKGNEKLMQRAI
jgi:hypothetical protein